MNDVVTNGKLWTITDTSGVAESGDTHLWLVNDEKSRGVFIESCNVENLVFEAIEYPYGEVSMTRSEDRETIAADLTDFNVFDDE